jgi:hypothetical protein
VLGKRDAIWVLRGLIPSEANSVRRSVYLRALEQMTADERKQIGRVQSNLIEHIRGIGATGSLEVVAAVGQWLNRNDPLRKQEGRVSGGV